jgi:cell surface protein SprA
MTWKNGVSTTLSYETSNLVSLNLDNSQVIERTSESIKFTSNFQKRGFRVPFFNATLRNTIDMAINLSYSEDETNDNRLDQKLEANVLQREVEDFNVDAYEIILDQPTGDTRINFSANVAYQFSATMKAGFEYRYVQVIPKSTATFRRLDQDFRFNIIVNIRSN